jgi:hypothetical protein
MLDECATRWRARLLDGAPLSRPWERATRLDEITVDIQSGAIEGRFPRRALSLVMEWLDVHRDELMSNWRKLESDLAPDKLDPLP